MRKCFPVFFDTRGDINVTVPVGAVALAIVCLCVPERAVAQRLDPDWCWGCRDSWEHVAAGAGVGVAANWVLPRARPWQRVVVVAAVGAAYEFGQESAGGVFGPKDLICDVAGAVVVEVVASLWR